MQINRSSRTALAAWLLVSGGVLSPLAAGLACAADAPPLILDHLTPAEGLPQGTVMATLQDSQGFVWFATQDGLVRYDGVELVRYAYTRNAPKGLPGNFIYQMTEDAHHDLWMAVKDAGVARWNRASDDFTVFRHDSKNPASLASDATRSVAVDPQGAVWIGTSDSGVDILDATTGRVQHRRHEAAQLGSLADNQVFNISRDRAGTMWVATAGGLDRWVAEQRSFLHWRHMDGDPHSVSGLQVSQIAEDRDGTLWVGTFDGGLDHLDREGRVQQVYRHDARVAGSLSADDVHAVLVDRVGHVWAGTSEGLDLIDRNSESVTHFRHEDGDAGSLRDSYVWSLYEDGAGLVWIGTNAGGVSRWNPRSWELGGHRPGWLTSKLVTSFADAGRNQVWVGSLGGGLVRFDDSTGQATDFDTLYGRRNALGDARVMSLLTDRDGTLWIGTMTSGLRKYSEYGNLTAIPARPGDAYSLSAAGIMTLYQSLNGWIWTGTHGGGVNAIDPQTGVVRQLPFAAQGNAPPAGAVSNPNVSAIAQDAQGDMWFGTDGGGLDFADANGVVKHVFRNDSGDAHSLPSNTVYAIGFDERGVLWVATDKGVAHMEGMISQPDRVKFTMLGREEGLSSDTVYSMLKDRNGQLWMSSNAGLMRYDPQSRSLKTFHVEHGLQGEEFDMNAYQRLNNGKLCFGGPGGFNIFDPAQLTNAVSAPRIALTRLEVLGAPVPSVTPYWLLDHIELDHLASIVSLDFSALDFTSPRRNRLAYRVAGLSDRWIDLGAQHRITLTNLDAGDHVLEVRAANADSVWSNPPLRLTLHRAPPLWRTWWACATYGVLLLLLVAWRVRAHRERFARVERAKLRLESEVALRTRELLESNRQLEDASQAKSNFLARMSHELRTPLNGVVGSAELLARSGLQAGQIRLTDTIRSSSKVLLQIVNDLLDLSKAQAGKITFETLPFDLLPVLEESAALFAASAQEKGVELTVDPPPLAHLLLRGDALRLRQILMNLIGNALKFTAHGEIRLKADLVESGRSEGGQDGQVRLEISVADSGIGMDAATIDKVFEAFTQADESTTRRFGGTGLGLAICRELAEGMGGSIRVESQLQVGSTFHVSLPLERSARGTARPVSPSAPHVRVITRRPSLEAALLRHAAALGWSASTGAGGHDEPGAAIVYVIDAASLESRHAQFERLIVLTHDAQAQRLPAAVDAQRRIVVQKPVLRRRLSEAVAQALGTPLAEAQSATPADAAPNLRCHVLLVDDEPVNAAVAQGYLAEMGCSSVWVDNGAEAVTRSSGERFDLIMMDLNMPHMDGFAAVRLIRAAEAGRPRVPIVALTAHDAESYRAACLEAGMNDIMSKPYTFEQCAALLQRLLGTAPAAVVAGTRAAQPQAGEGAPLDALAEIDLGTVVALRNLRGVGAEDLYPTLSRLFAASSAEAVTTLRAALEVKDTQAMGSVCHRLAAAAANVGALGFARAARQIEQLSAAGDFARVQPRCTQLIDALPLLLENMTRLKLQASA